MSGPYVNDDGDIWVERGAVKWKDAYREAWSVVDGSWSWADVGLRYEGIQRGVLVSDHNEYPCDNAPECGGCRYIDAYHFRQVER